MASRPFVEELLGQALTHDRAAAMYDILKELGLGKTARPLLLAFEAVLENKEAALEALEPEIRTAAQVMFVRLRAGRDAQPKAATKEKRTQRPTPPGAAPTKKQGSHTAAFKARVALAALGGERSVEELAKEHDLSAATIKQWIQQAQNGMLSALADKDSPPR